MNINLATIDFCPGQGGGEAVIRNLEVTANGTYRAPSGVDGYNPVKVNVSGGSLTPEEQAALDTLVDSSEGVLYTETYERYIQQIIISQNNIYPDGMSSVFWDDLYCIDDSANLYKINRETYQLDKINHFNGLWVGPSFFGDKSGRFYWNGYELDLENGTIGQDQILLPDYYKYSTMQNIFYGEYGVWIIGFGAYKFNESSQEFEQMTLNNTSGHSGNLMYCNLFRYDGHILGVDGDITFEVTEYEDHIDVSDVTGVYFNMPSFGASLECFKSTTNGDLYYISDYNIYVYDKSSGVWVYIDDKEMRWPVYGYASLVSDNIIFSAINGSLNYMNLGPEFSSTYWKKISNVAVDLTSSQKIRGYKQFEDDIKVSSIQVVNGIISLNNMLINAQNKNIRNVGTNIVFSNNQNNETIVKNGTKHIATVDQTFVNSTFIPYGTDGDNIGYVNGNAESMYNFNTYTNRMFKMYADNWYEFDGTSTLIPVSFGFTLNGDQVYNSPTMTIAVVYDNDTYNTYMWDDVNTEWDLICSSNNFGGSVWFDGDGFRSGNEWKLEETGGVWSWVSDPLVNNIYEYYLKFGYKNGEVYAYNDNDWCLYKYDKVNCTLDKIGFVNAGKLYSYFDELFMAVSTSEVHIIDLSKVDPQDPDKNLLGKYLFDKSPYGFIGAKDRLWYYNSYNEMCSSYQKIYETPEVPASNGTYVLQATRVGDQITYEWVSNVI